MVLIVSCTPKTVDWQTLDFGDFKLKAPQGWNKFEAEGIDSYVGGLTNGKDSLRFDYGWYSNDLSEEAATQYMAMDTINGFSAVIVIPETNGKGIIGMHIPRVTKEDKFTLYGQGITAIDTVLKIFKSVTFQGSDTTKNGLLTQQKFHKNPWGTGGSVFKANCASCHSKHKTMTGPPLSERLEIRDANWLYEFLTQRQLVKADSAFQQLAHKYELECPEFPQLPKEAVDGIYRYVKDL